ncbi:hypothetical protein BO71DRAFT_278728, partial [Aspergillus ellipticus CBS 707.79]
VRSIPFLLFIDDFGVHRNMYKALKAFYLTPAGLTYRERRYLDNSFTLTLGPHGAKMEDSIQAFKKEIWTLSQGFYAYLYGVRTVITASIIAFTGDMPQQAKNSGAQSYSAEFGCRTCYCPKNSRHDLKFDSLLCGRYHFEIKSFRKYAESLSSPAKQIQFLSSKGLLPHPSPLELLAPSLDLVLSRPYDIPHSDWKGLGLRLQSFMLRILNPQGTKKYSAALR